MAQNPSKKVAARRYYLHKKLKHKYLVDGRNRTIDMPFGSFEDIPQGDRYYVGQLIKMRYNIQFKLF